MQHWLFSCCKNFIKVFTVAKKIKQYDKIMAISLNSAKIESYVI